MPLKDLKPGDKVTRLISSEKIPMDMVVDRIENGLVHCRGGWTFDVVTGAEVDDDLMWGPLWNRTGSFLVVSDGS